MLAVAMKDKLNKLESRLQELIEVRLVNALLGKKAEWLVAQQIATALQSQVVKQDGKQTAPNVYTLLVNPETATKWQSTDGFIETLLDILTTAAQETEIQFAVPPTITIATDASLSIEDVRVIASSNVDSLAETKGMPDEIPGDANPTDPLPANAFLIVDSVKVFPLDKSMINIGRRLGNHLVIDDPRVSRNHAQLRAIKGRFVLFDLDSTGGTFINGQRVNQTILYPGDVISLAGVPLIFGQDNPMPRPDLIDTAPFSSQSGERPTAILKKPDHEHRKK
jgi:hypothetical protein